MTVATHNGSHVSLSAAGRLDRNRRIAEAREIEGLSWPAIGERFGLSDRHARRAYEDFRESVERGEVAAIDVTGAVARVVRVHLSALARAEALVDGAGESNAGVGVLRVAASVGASLLDVLQRTGHLPDRSDVALRRRIQEELRDLAEVFVRAADEHGVPDAVVSRVLEIAEGRSRAEVPE